MLEIELAVKGGQLTHKKEDTLFTVRAFSQIHVFNTLDQMIQFIREHYERFGL